jgi:hypothetical protein
VSKRERIAVGTQRKTKRKREEDFLQREKQRMGKKKKRASTSCVQDLLPMLSLYRRPERCRLFQHQI